jgi:hypothetical protein
MMCAMPGTWLLVTWAGGGNVNPMLCLAGRLRERGHRVGVVAGASLAPRLRIVPEPDRAVGLVESLLERANAV